MDHKLLDLALKCNLAVYDASYLSLAISLGHPMATNDRKLIAAAEVSGVKAFVP